MKTRCIFLGLLLLATGAKAADPARAAVTHFDSRFTQTRNLQGFSNPLVSHGVIRFDQAHGFYWEITDPYHYVFQMQGDTAVQTLPDGSVKHLKAEQTPWLAAVQHIVVDALSGDRSELERYFSLKVTPLTEGERVDLTPKSGAMQEAIVSIQVTESAPGHPQKIAIRETSGDSMDISFTAPAP